MHPPQGARQSLRIFFCCGTPTMPYYVATGACVASMWTLIMCTAIVAFAMDVDTDFMRWGPSDVRFGGMRINTWARWAAVMVYSVLSQVAYSVVSSTLSPYISNVIRDHKTPQSDKGSLVRAQVIVQLYTLYHWMSSIFDVFLWITLQVQYIVPAVITDLALTVHFTNRFMRRVDETLIDRGD